MSPEKESLADQKLLVVEKTQKLFAKYGHVIDHQTADVLTPVNLALTIHQLAGEAPKANINEEILDLAHAMLIKSQFEFAGGRSVNNSGRTNLLTGLNSVIERIGENSGLTTEAVNEIYENVHVRTSKNKSPHNLSSTLYEYLKSL